MPINRGNFAALLEPGLRQIWGDTWDQFPEQFSQVFDVFTSMQHNETDQSITGFGHVANKSEGQAIGYDTAYQGFTKTYTHTTYGLGFIVTREMVEDDLYRKIAQLPAALATSVRQSIELQCAAVLNNAFSGGTAMPDGKQLCDQTRPLVAGGTWQNEPTTPADLSVVALEQAYIDIGNWVDDRNKKINAMVNKLIISTSDAWNARVILNSAQMPGTPNNDLNPAQNAVPGGVVVMNWLTDTDAWFLKTNVPNGLTYFWRRRPEFTRDNDFDTENAKFKVTYRNSVGATEPRGIYGVPGG